MNHKIILLLLSLGSTPNVHSSKAAATKQPTMPSTDSKLKGVLPRKEKAFTTYTPSNEKTEEEKFF